MGKTYTVKLTEQELNDLRAALPSRRPSPTGDRYGQAHRQWDLDDKLKRLRPDPELVGKS